MNTEKADGRAMQAGASRSSTTADLAAWLTELDAARLPGHVVERVKDLVLDHLGVALHGAELPWAKAVREQAVADGGPAQCALYAAGRVALRSAAFANATAAHAIELDDTHDESLSHPGAVVIPVALALAELHGAHGHETIAAIVAGYEAQGRIGACAGKSLYLGGFHPTSTSGTFGAAACAARLLGLGAHELVNAWGLALSMASGSMQFSEDPVGTMVKRIHAGLPAQSGILAAQLAARGYLAPSESIEGRYGFVRLFAGHGDFGRLNRSLGDPFEIERISVKLYACCRLFHALIDAIDECRRARDFASAEVRAVTVHGPAMLYAQHMEYAPDSVMSAQYSLPYAVASALLFDPRDPDVYGPDHYRRSDVLALARLVRAEHSPTLEALCPVKFPAAVRIELADGSSIERTVEDSRGTPVRPLDRADVLGKFDRLVGERLAPGARAALVDAVMDLDAPEGAKRLVERLAEPGLLRGEAARPSRAPSA